MFRSISALMVGAGCAVVTGCGGVADDPGVASEDPSPEVAPAPIEPHAIGRVHLMVTDQAREATSLETAQVIFGGGGRTLSYWDGPVISSITVNPVFWNSNVNSSANPTFQSDITAFYSAIVTGAEMTFLAQYSTSSPKQTIGNGTLGTVVVSNQMGTSLMDSDVQSFLTGLFNSGALPKPNNNDYYPVHFPSGVTINSGGSKSCVQFCAYHGTYQYNGQDVYYGVVPDLNQPGCNGGCGGSTVLNNTTVVSSHELAETVTDPAVGVASFPFSIFGVLGWYNFSYGEIGDICSGQQTTAVLGDGKSYTVQKLWSNKSNACVTP
jgi:hypothetical protein